MAASFFEEGKKEKEVQEMTEAEKGEFAHPIVIGQFIFVKELAKESSMEGKKMKRLKNSH